MVNLHYDTHITGEKCLNHFRIETEIPQNIYCFDNNSSIPESQRLISKKVWFSKTSNLINKLSLYVCDIMIHSNLKQFIHFFFH